MNDYTERLEAAKRWLGPRYLLAAPINKPRVGTKGTNCAQVVLNLPGVRQYNWFEQAIRNGCTDEI